MTIALLFAAGLVGGHVYAARVEAGGAQVAVWRYAAAGTRRGPPVVMFGELGFDKSLFDFRGDGLARALQARGREVFVLEWRGTGHSAQPLLPSLGGLDALFGGDAPAALQLALETMQAPCAQLIGFGLGGAAAYLMSRQACAVVAISVPAAYEVPNENLRRLLRAVQRVPASARAGSLLPWADVPSPLNERRDLFSLWFGDVRGLRQSLGRAAPALFADVARWMEAGDLALGPGPLMPAQRLGGAIAALRAPLLIVTAPRDNLVHPEHALALKAPHDTIVLSRIEGYPRDADHLSALQTRELFPEIASWLDSH